MDTETCISYLKDRYAIPDKIESVGIENCFISEITILELTYGAYYSNRLEHHLQEVEKIRLLYDVIPIQECVEHFSKEKVRLRRIG